MQPIASIIAALSILCASTIARADKTEARTHYKAAKALCQAQDWDACIREFEAAYAAFPEPNFLYTIGTANEGAGRPEQAVAAYERYLQAAPDGQKSADAKDRIAALRKPSPPAAQTEEPGGDPPAVAAPQAQPPPQAQPAPPLALVPTPAPPPTAAVEARPVPRARPLYRRPWFWTVIGVAAAGVAGGVTAGVLLGTKQTYQNPYSLNFQPNPVVLNFGK